MAINEEKLNQLLGRFLDDFGAVFHGAMVVIGDKLGLYKALAGGGPLTPKELADRTETAERYVREWLGAMTTGRVIDYDPANRTYRLPPEHAAFLTRAAGPNNLATMTQFMALTAAGTNCSSS